MAITGLNIHPLIKKEIDPIISSNDSQLANIQAVFKNANNNDFSVVVSKFIKELRIVQDYVQFYSDKIRITCAFTVPEYESLRQWRKDLLCDLTIYKIQLQNTLDLKNVLHKKVYRVMFLTQIDPFRQASSTTLLGGRNPATNNMPTQQPDLEAQRITCVMELVPDDLYALRKKSTHFIARDVTMDKLLKYVAYQLGINNLSIIQPDNQKVYENFILPPFMGIDDVFTFLQKGPGNGVYNLGFCYYYTQEVLYVYPRFAQPQKRAVIHCYSVGNNLLTGKLSNHIKSDDGSISIMINTEVTSTDYNDIGAENDCTGIMMQIADKLWLNTHNMANDNHEINVLDSNFKTIHGPTPDGMSKDNIYLKYEPTHGNEFAICSKLVRMRGTEINFSWDMAVPWTFKPNRVVYFHYEKNGVFETDVCSCERVVYTYTQTDSRQVPTFTCQADITLSANLEGLEQ